MGLEGIQGYAIDDAGGEAIPGSDGGRKEGMEMGVSARVRDEEFVRLSSGLVRRLLNGPLKC